MDTDRKADALSFIDIHLIRHATELQSEGCYAYHRGVIYGVAKAAGLAGASWAKEARDAWQSAVDLEQAHEERLRRRE